MIWHTIERHQLRAWYSRRDGPYALMVENLGGQVERRLETTRSYDANYLQVGIQGGKLYATEEMARIHRNQKWSRSLPVAAVVEG